MTDFAANPARADPYRNYRFRILWDGRIVAGASRVSGLGRPTGAVRHRDGADASIVRLPPGQTGFDAVTIARGISHDTGFARWANMAWDRSGGGGSLEGSRKDIRIELYDEAEQLVLAYDVYRCWPSEFVASAELDGEGGALLIQSLTLQNEGWKRDPNVVEPPAPA